MEDTRELLKDYVADMLALENHIRGAIVRQVDDQGVNWSSDTLGLLARINRVMQEHIDVLDGLLEARGKNSRSVAKVAATSLTGLATGLYDRFRGTDPVSRNLRDDYTALNLAAASYTMLHTAGLAMGDEEVAETALHHLNHYTPLIMELSRAIPETVARELAQEHSGVDPSVAEQAVNNTQRAWIPEEKQKSEAS